MRPETFSDIKSLTQEVYEFVGKIRPEGRVIVPESSCVNFSYGLNGMELMLRIAGLRIEAPLHGHGKILTASKR